jgi:hypothetical protein
MFLGVSTVGVEAGIAVIDVRWLVAYAGPPHEGTLDNEDALQYLLRVQPVIAAATTFHVYQASQG